MTETFMDIISTTGVVGVVAAFVGTLVILMERTHRRTSDLSRAPFGADLEGDSDLRRLRDELRAAAGRDERGGSGRRQRTHTFRVQHTRPGSPRRLSSV